MDNHGDTLGVASARWQPAVFWLDRWYSIQYDMLNSVWVSWAPVSIYSICLLFRFVFVQHKIWEPVEIHFLQSPLILETHLLKKMAESFKSSTFCILVCSVCVPFTICFKFQLYHTATGCPSFVNLSNVCLLVHFFFLVSCYTLSPYYRRSKSCAILVTQTWPLF